mmetsp:Transcript_11641/g.40505  ORF Transcript_11641/g.40505 Transcript_11641/m.40505 type:complete len:498 (-) Transcript_11641:1142-2635(-)
MASRPAKELLSTFFRYLEGTKLHTERPNQIRGCPSSYAIVLAFVIVAARVYGTPGVILLLHANISQACITSVRIFAQHCISNAPRDMQIHDGVKERDISTCFAGQYNMEFSSQHVQQASYTARWVHRIGYTDAYQYAHMGNLEQLLNGTLVATWQAASQVEGQSDQQIWLSFSKDSMGEDWWPARRLSNSPVGTARWGPVPLINDVGKLCIFFAESHDCLRPGSGRVPPRWVPGGDIKMTCLLNMNSFSWSDLQVLLTQDHDGGAPKVIANRPIILHTGTIMLPFWREAPRGIKVRSSMKCAVSEHKATAGVLTSHDGGSTWQKQGDIGAKDSWLIENTAAQLSDGRILMMFRTLQDVVYCSQLQTPLKNWSTPKPVPGLPNPDSKVHLLILQGVYEGVLALAFNDHVKYQSDGWARMRTKLRIALSWDGGTTWMRIAEIDERLEPGWQYHYPTMTQVRCKLLLIYSRTYLSRSFQLSSKKQSYYRASGIRLATVSI